jgi:hypothetical protein
MGSGKWCHQENGARPHFSLKEKLKPFSSFIYSKRWA